MGHLFSRKAREQRKKKSDDQIILEGEVCLDHFEILRSIGRGSFGKVCIVQRKDNKNLYALKYMSKEKCYAQGALQNVLKELRIMKKLSHPFLVNLWYAFQDEEDMFMVLDLMLGGDIRFHLNEGKHFTEQQITLYLAEVGLALDYLHQRQIIHRDIKPDNLLLDEKGHVHLTDFNIATVLKDHCLATSLSGTKAYMAPEIFGTYLNKVRGYSHEVDWWSLGVTICEMIRGKRPFSINSDTDAATAHNIFMSELVLELPTSLSENLVRVIKRLLQPDPLKRLSTVKHLKEASVMKNIDFDEVLAKEIIMSFIPSRDNLNCDPTYELEEMIIESKPLHKKKKRLHKQLSKKVSASAESNSTSVSSKDPYQQQLELLNTEFAIFDRTKDNEESPSSETKNSEIGPGTQDDKNQEPQLDHLNSLKDDSKQETTPQI
ncbi:serine/threonine-protein kinase 32A-like isoform X1 [Rhopilema esculentum]|uniref:serine/threonine-protein kinase 32A-like isoform X1 n=1 Tax=Rhopilema esculentum TaxID=499914 RepID=UPI0031E0AF8D|eukprot:gene11959-2535_t